MLHGFSFQDVLRAMESSKFNFYLTGSHYFGTSGKDSDIDFFVEPSQDLNEFLRELGFMMVTSKYYDYLTLYVYRKQGIDIQVCSDPRLKLRVQSLFKKANLLFPSTRDWEFAFRLLSDAE